MPHEIAPRSGVAFTLDKGQRLTVIDPQGEQVADLLAYNRDDIGEVVSSGRTLDYASRIYLTIGDPLYCRAALLVPCWLSIGLGEPASLRSRSRIVPRNLS